MDKYMRVRADISLDAAEYNIKSMYKNLKGDTKLAAVIKADGYGHGAAEIAKRLETMDEIWGFCTATYEEAAALREKWISKPILILGYVFPYCYEELVKKEIRPVVFRKDQLFQLNNAAQTVGCKLKVHIGVDTAMSRIGIRPDDEGLYFVKSALSYENLEIEGIFTHFSKADEIMGVENTKRQHDRFAAFCDRIEKELGYRIPICHCSNSAGIVTYPEYRMDMARAGITLYGLWPSGEVDKNLIDLKPVMSLKSHVVYTKTIQAGDAVSYGGTFVADKPTRVATIPVGYADGYPRSLSNKGYVLIRGKKAPILGRVCMDQFMVCIDDIPDAREGDEVTLLGKDHDEVITAELLGDLSGRFNYELVCDITARVPRIIAN